MSNMSVLMFIGLLQRIALRYASHRLHCLVLVGGIHSV